MSTKFTEWTKRLGQQHFAMYDGTGRTLCGMPMLGNNYAKHIDEEAKHLVRSVLTKRSCIG